MGKVARYNLNEIMNLFEDVMKTVKPRGKRDLYLRIMQERIMSLDAELTSMEQKIILLQDLLIKETVSIKKGNS